MEYCKRCDKEKESMDMHSRDLCKICWLTQLEEQTSDIGLRTWITRRERYGWRGHKGYYKGEKVKTKVGKNYY